MRRDREQLPVIRLAIIFLAISSPAAAQQTDKFRLPAGCDAYLTVQDRSCSVDHHFRCDTDPSGHQRRVSFDEEGMTYLGMIDAETQWIQSFHARAGSTERLAPAPNDPASFSQLIATGRDDYDFVTLSDKYGPTHFKGTDTLTGRDVEIDGVVLQETAFQITATTPDGTVLWTSQGNEFISRDWQMFVSGTGTTTTPTDSFEKDDTPVEFIYPGEPGFLSTRPKHGCGVMLSAAPHIVGDHT